MLERFPIDEWLGSYLCIGFIMLGVGSYILNLIKRVYRWFAGKNEPEI